MHDLGSSVTEEASSGRTYQAGGHSHLSTKFLQNRLSCLHSAANIKRGQLHYFCTFSIWDTATQYFQPPQLTAAEGELQVPS